MTMTQPIRTSVAGPTGERRLFAARGPDLLSHLDAFGPMPAAFDHGHLVAEVGDSGLGERFGASFSIWRRLIAATEASWAGRGARSAVVVASVAERPDLRRKDSTLLACAPHLVLDGLLLVAASVHARSLVLVAPSGALEGVARALADRPEARGIRLVTAASHPGEASAITAALSEGSPTLVQDVENLAHLALLARFGSTWFRSTGSPDDPGTRLVSVSGYLPAPRVIEVPGGAPLSQALASAGADRRSLRAVRIGGPQGAWVPGDRLDAALSKAGLAPFRTDPGPGPTTVSDLTVIATDGAYRADAARRAGRAGR